MKSLRLHNIITPREFRNNFVFGLNIDDLILSRLIVARGSFYNRIIIINTRSRYHL